MIIKGNKKFCPNCKSELRHGYAYFKYVDNKAIKVIYCPYCDWKIEVKEVDVNESNKGEYSDG